ncbi:MAG: hypothetical protein JWR44_1706 [Hymenobacter sp.]|nr:hypothetical protein [Hymenobacter sp.]
MRKQKRVYPRPTNCAERRRTAVHVHTTYDAFGGLAAEYTFYPNARVLYVRWHGHMTSDELVRAAQVGLKINQQLQPLGLVQDTRGSSGDWGDANSWLTYEWIPRMKAKCASLRGIAVLLNADASVPYSNAQVLAQLDKQFELGKFYAPITAWRGCAAAPCGLLNRQVSTGSALRL